jgi:hypothetical protein
MLLVDKNTRPLTDEPSKAPAVARIYGSPAINQDTRKPYIRLLRDCCAAHVLTSNGVSSIIRQKQRAEEHEQT